MSEPILIEFDNQLSDHLAAARLYYKSTFWSKGDKIAAVLLVFGGVTLLLSIGPRWWILALFPLAIVEWFNLLSPARVRTLLFFKRNRKFLETYHLSFSDSGIAFKTESIDSTIAWTHYSCVLEDESVILLIYGSQLYTVIPKRAFRDTSQLEAFKK